MVVVSAGPRAALAVCAALTCAATAARADELGRIAARFDGAELVWQTVAVRRADGTMATASLRLGPRMTELYLQGHRAGGDTRTDVFSLDLRYGSPYSDGAEPLFADILYMPEGMGGPFWTSDGAAEMPTIRVLTLEVWGGFGRVDAVFAGELCLKERITAAPDPTRCKEVTGRVETELFVE